MTNLADQIEITGVRDQVDITSVTDKANITNSETNMRDITNILDIYEYTLRYIKVFSLFGFCFLLLLYIRVITKLPNSEQS